MKAGKLRYLGADVLDRLLTEPEYVPEVVARSASGPLVTRETRIATGQPELLSIGRALTASDRILLLGSGEHSALGAVSDRALTQGVDVWMLSAELATQAVSVIDRLSITLCLGAPDAAETFINCVDGANEPLAADRLGWLVSPGNSSATALSAGYVDQQGWIHALGPAGHCLVTESGLLAPFEGVARLESHSRVNQACVFAVAANPASDTQAAKSFFAVAETTSEPSPVLEVELLDYLRRGLSADKCPQGILLVSSLPRQADGGLDRVAARELVLRETNSAADLPASTGQ